MLGYVAVIASPSVIRTGGSVIVEGEGAGRKGGLLYGGGLSKKAPKE